MSTVLQNMGQNGTNIMAMMLKGQYLVEEIDQNGFNALNSVEFDRYSLLRNSSKLLSSKNQYNFFVAKSKPSHSVL